MLTRRQMIASSVILPVVNQAVASMRRQLGESRVKFAARVGMNSKMVQRIEEGDSPSQASLLKLAYVAKQAGFGVEADLFDAVRRSNMSARIASVRGTGRIRRIALADLKQIRDALQAGVKEIKSLNMHIPDSISRETLIDQLRQAALTMRVAEQDLRIAIAEPEVVRAA